MNHRHLNEDPSKEMTINLTGSFHNDRDDNNSR